MNKVNAYVDALFCLDLRRKRCKREIKRAHRVESISINGQLHSGWLNSQLQQKNNDECKAAFKELDESIELEKVLLRAYYKIP